MDENRERVNGLEAAAIHHHRPASDQADRAAQDHELVTNSPYRLAVVLGEIGQWSCKSGASFPVSHMRSTLRLRFVLQSDWTALGSDSRRDRA
jgi:hypothetical protein